MTNDGNAPRRAEAGIDAAAEAGDLVYEGEAVRVRWRPARGATLVVTFTGRSSRPPAAKGFGESYFEKRKIPAIYFISKANHWWQTPETGAAVAAVVRRGLLDGYERIVLYGSSMGGYAALITSGALRADEIIVVSPQFSIDAAVVPFEKRWRDYARKLTFDFDDMRAGISGTARVWAVVDPFFTPDVAHVGLIEALRPVERIAVTFACHNTARCLEEAGIMQGALETLLEGRFDRDAFDAGYRERRVTSSLFWYGLAETLFAHGRGAWAGGAAALAADMLVKGARMRDALLHNEILRLAFRTALERGDRARAREWLAALAAAAPDHPLTRLAQARFAAGAGDPAAALTLAEAARAQLARNGEAVTLLIEAMEAAGQDERALRFATVAAEHQRREWPIHAALARMQAKLGRREDALATLQTAHRRGSRLARNHILLAELLFSRARHDAARAQLRYVLGRTLAAAGERAAVAALAANLGLDAEAARFAARAAAADRLYGALLDARDSIDPAAPNASMIAARESFRRRRAAA